MYYFIYSLLYIFSLLPFPVIYFVSDGIYGLIYYVFGYRKKVVLQNLLIAFPEKTEKERTRIAKDFYHGFIDTFIETIKLFSITKKSFLKLVDGNYEIINELTRKGKSVQLQSGHHFNWEYANWLVANKVNITFHGIYMPIKNKALNKIFYNLRAKYGTRLISAIDFKSQREEMLQQQYILGLVADQNPGNPKYAHWLNFFNRPAPFVTGPARGAVKNNTAIVFVRFKKIKRGRYYFYYELVTENAAEYTEQQLTLKYRDFIEQSVREQPFNYLWSHRRWKWEFKDEYKNLWIDDRIK
ncbi:MAG: lysophospholipid acyltransferase family protein [Chitinophagaceae bacterium]|nr:lysophospholipid acyltransferase family protein [Chitinophagaceae bacterium]